MSDPSSRHLDGGVGRYRAPPISEALRAALRTLHDELRGGVIGPAMDDVLDRVPHRGFAELAGTLLDAEIAGASVAGVAAETR